MQITPGISIFGSRTDASSRASNTTKAAWPANSTIEESSSKQIDADNVVEEFLNYAKMTPFDRMRASVLKSMHLTETDLQQMSPEQKAAVEQKIKEAIENQVKDKGKKPGSVVDVSA